MNCSTITPTEVRRRWRDGQELALVDVREEGPYAESHPFFAISVPVSEVEEKLPALVPRSSALIVVYDDSEDYTGRAVDRILSLGYTDVRILKGGLAAYARVGEVFRDVNVPCKAFGELVEAIRHTPSLPAREIQELIEQDPDVVVVDARRFEEYNTMSIPHGRSCPGGELVYRILDLAPSPDTKIVVNCAGRTRSIIGTQSLINSGIPNKVMALRNGTIGWTLEGLEVDRGKVERVSPPSHTAHQRAKANAESWANHVGVPIITGEQVSTFITQSDERTLYLLDVRTPEEYAEDHPAGFVSAPGGQLVQATDEWISVRGARIILYDTDGVRARMAGSWLLQMGWDVHVLGTGVKIPSTAGIVYSPRWTVPGDGAISVSELHSRNDIVIVDLARSPEYRKGHIPGAYYLSGPELPSAINRLPGDGTVVLTSPNGRIAAANVREAQQVTPRRVLYLSGGTDAWRSAGYETEKAPHWVSDPEKSVYKRPYEGTDNARANMQAYIDWELQLVAQLANDGISGFRVARAAPE
jgi:rhodanese-related sulfurtransferase